MSPPPNGYRFVWAKPYGPSVLEQHIQRYLRERAHHRLVRLFLDRICQPW